MDMRSWTWGHLLVLTAAYRVVLAAAWSIYRTRPAVQARGSERALVSETIEETIEPATADLVDTFHDEIRPVRLALVPLGPPAPPIVAWLLARG